MVSWLPTAHFIHYGGLQMSHFRRVLFLLNSLLVLFLFHVFAPAESSADDPFKSLAFILLSPGEGNKSEIIFRRIPDGKVFILTDVNITLSDNKGPGVNYSVAIVIENPDENVPRGFVVSPVLTTKGNFSGQGWGGESFSTPTDIPVEAGEEIYWHVQRDDPTEEGHIYVTISGVFKED